jgi:hypothetical protein
MRAGHDACRRGDRRGPVTETRERRSGRFDLDGVVANLPATPASGPTLGRHLQGVQSTAGGCATVIFVLSEGAFAKSNISSSGLACWSRFVACWIGRPRTGDRLASSLRCRRLQTGQVSGTGFPARN